MSIDADGRLQGVSGNSAAGIAVEELTASIPNRQVGVATVGEIEALGGTVTPSPLPDNPYHSILGGITAGQAETLFTPTIPNPNVP